MGKRVMQLQFAQYATGLFWGKSFIQGGRRVRVQIVQHDPDPGSLGKVNFNQILHTLGEILFGVLPGDFDMPPAGQRLQKQEQVAGPAAPIFKIITPGFPFCIGSGNRVSLTI
jgi:hypothetical protein